MIRGAIVRVRFDDAEMIGWSEKIGRLTAITFPIT